MCVCAREMAGSWPLYVLDEGFEKFGVRGFILNLQSRDLSYKTARKLENVKLTKVSSSKLSRSKDSFKSPGLSGFVLQKI